MSARGMTLLEVLVALALLAIIMAALLPAFMNCMQTTTRNEVRTGAAAAAQRVLEMARRADPASLPDSGSVGPLVVTVGANDYDVVTRYCLRSELCDSGSRHILVEVRYDGEILFTAETVYTQLR